MTIAEAGDFGVVRMVVDDTERGYTEELKYFRRVVRVEVAKDRKTRLHFEGAVKS